jgi:hypothetical protein
MNQKDTKQGRKEREYYKPIKDRLEEILRAKSYDFHLEVTAYKQFSNELKAEIKPGRDITFSFLNEAAPDLTGFVKAKYSSDFIIVEIKREPIKIDPIYQTRKYAELFNAKHALLISTEEIPEEIKRLAKVVHPLLSGGYGYERTSLAYFDPDKGDFIEWFESDPFIDFDRLIEIEDE